MNEHNDFIKEVIELEEIDGFWLKYDEFCESLPELSINLEEFISFLPRLFEKIGNNMSSGNIYTGIRNLSKTRTKIGLSLLEEIKKSEDGSTIGLIPNIIWGLSESEKNIEVIPHIKNLIESEEDVLLRVGLLSTINIKFSEEKAEQVFQELVVRNLEKHIDSKDSKTLMIITRIYGRFRSKIKNSDSILLTLSSKQIPEIQSEIADLLWRHIKVGEEEKLYSQLLLDLAASDVKYGGIYQDLKFALPNVLKSNPPLLISFFEKWVNDHKREVDQIKIFESIFIDLYRKRLTFFKVLLTNWLNKNEAVFHRAIFIISNSLFQHKINDFSVSKAIIEKMPSEDVLYIITKGLAYIIHKNQSATYLYSILQIRVNDDKIVDLIKRSFVSYLIYNYPSTTDYLKEQKKTASKELKGIIKEIIDSSDNYYNSISNLPIRKEFSPSEIRLKYYNKIQSKKFNESFKENEKKPGSLRSLFKTINFRAGKKSFAKFEGQYSGEMEPKLISHSAELPRGEFIDPVGQARLRLIWANYKKEK